MLLLCLGAGVGVTDCHSQCTHWLRNDRGFCMGCGGTTGDRKGRPYGGHGGAVGRRATARVAPTGGTVVRWDGGRPQGSPLRRARWCGGAGDRKGRPYGGECTPVKMPRRVCRLRAAKLCARQTGDLLAEKSEIFRQGRQKGCPGSGQPL